jgi:hypothetical protein
MGAPRMNDTRHTDGEAFAYFRWHSLRYPNAAPFSQPRPWRLSLWRDGKRSRFDYYREADNRSAKWETATHCDHGVSLVTLCKQCTEAVADEDVAK